MPRAPFTLAAVVIALALSACGGPAPEPTGAPGPSETVAGPTPTPTPTPTAPPAAEDLVLTADGMGNLVFGEAPTSDPVIQMIAEDPAACADVSTGFDAGIEVGDPEAIRWRPVGLYNTDEYTMFGVEVRDGVLRRIDLFTPDIPTDGGIRIGSSDGDVTAAYPGAAIVSNDLTDVYVVNGTHGTLQIEVAREHGVFDSPYWSTADQDHVVYIHAVVAGVDPFTVVASENIAGGCL